MKRDLQASKLLVLSEKAYSALLILYPTNFREVYSQHMLQVFRDVCRDTYRHGGAVNLVRWWLATLFDLVQTVIAERRKVGLMMSQAKFIQWTGWLFIFGGIFFAAGSVSQLQSNSGIRFDGVYQLSLYALVPAMALIMLGLLGILLRYWANMVLFGKLALLTAIFGAGVTSIGWLFALAGVNGFYNLFMIGWLIHLMGHSVFGGFAMTTHLLPKWNFALLIGSAFPLTVVVLGLGSQQTASGVNWATFVMMMLISIGWLLTGWAFNSHPSTSVQSVISA